jgi:hypothetical protein
MSRFKTQDILKLIDEDEYVDIPSCAESHEEIGDKRRKW